MISHRMARIESWAAKDRDLQYRMYTGHDVAPLDVQRRVVAARLATMNSWHEILDRMGEIRRQLYRHEISDLEREELLDQLALAESQLGRLAGHAPHDPDDSTAA